MDKRSWPWKKKSSSKAVGTNSAAESLSSSGGNPAVDQPSTKNANFVQISAESYAHLTGLEDLVKDLNEKLSTAKSEINTKDDLVKQHAKVTEEAVSGWEKAEAEALALKNQLESVTLLQVTTDERAAHLDGALKECMKQIRIVKEESEQRLHDVVFAKTKQWEKLKSELDRKIIDFEQELLRASAENAALSKTLQECTDMLMKVSDEKSQADTEIEMQKSDLQSCEREINSLKYEIHVISKELEIRNEEKNMSMRSAEVANKQHVEDIKKITKLEAECQRLRGLVRKRLPGPAALAQMKLEVESLGRDYGEPRVRPASARGSRLRLDPVPDFASENFQQCQKENEFLTARLLAMEEETKMLKEALSNRNSELQASRNMCAKLRSIEEHAQVLDQHNSPSKPNIGILIEGSLKYGNQLSLTSMSEDGIDEDGRCSESCATLISEISPLKQATDIDKAKKADNPHPLDLMDDFLEMERLACLSTETDLTTSLPNDGVDKITNGNSDTTQTIQKDGCEEQPATFMTSYTELAGNFTTNGTCISLSKLQARIASIFESQHKGSDLNKILEDIRHIVKDAREELPQHSVSGVSEEIHAVDFTIDEKNYPEDIANTADNVMSLNQRSTSFVDAKNATDQEVKIAISQIQDFVDSLSKEAIKIKGRHSDDHELNKKFQKFTECVNKVLFQEIVLGEFIIVLSHTLSDVCELGVNLLRNSHNEGECCSSDYIDKVTLLENKVVQYGLMKERLSGASLDSHSPSDLEIEGPIGQGYDLIATVDKCTSGELEQFKLEKKNMEMELARCTESLEHTKVQLVETEQHLSVLQLELAACQKSNSLAETQLKCMTESYKLLESRTQELETEINLLQVKAESLENDLQQEKSCHEDDLAKYRELQEKMERIEKCATCSVSSDADPDDKMKQEREIAAAAEKLAECQETIFLLSKQLKAIRPQAELINFSPNDKQQTSGFLEDEPRRSCFGSEMEKMSVKIKGKSCSNEYNSNRSPTNAESSTCPKSPINPEGQKQRSRSSSSSSLASMMTPEKHGRGFGRFFSKSNR